MTLRVQRAQELVSALGGRLSGQGGMAKCPAHNDRNPSLSISQGASGKVLVHCHAGCEQEAVISKLRDLGLWGAPTQAAQSSNFVETYDYRDEGGQRLSQVVRQEGKRFYQRRPDGHDGWKNDLKGVRKVPYKLPELHAAPDKSQVVYVVEGEKDADALVALGLLATTNPGGAGKWGKQYSEVLRDRNVVVVPDKDKPGRRHAQQVVESLIGVASSVRLLELPGSGKDVSDWIAAGGNAAGLQELASACRLNTEDSPTDVAVRLKAAKARLATLPEWCVKDAGAPYERGTLEDLHFVRKHDPAEWARLKQALANINGMFPGGADNLAVAPGGGASNASRSV